MILTAWNNLVAPAIFAAHDSGSDEAMQEGIVAGVLALGGFVCCGIVGFWFLVQGTICFFAYSAQKRVPKEFQQLAPGLIWLNLIPLFQLIWNFFVFSKVPQSLQAALKAKGKDVGDCGQQLGLWYSIVAAASHVCGVVPFVNLACFVAMVVLCIMTLMAIGNAAKELPASGVAFDEQH